MVLRISMMSNYALAFRQSLYSWWESIFYIRCHFNEQSNKSLSIKAIIHFQVRIWKSVFSLIGFWRARWSTTKTLPDSKRLWLSVLQTFCPTSRKFLTLATTVKSSTVSCFWTSTKRSTFWHCRQIKSYASDRCTLYSKKSTWRRFLPSFRNVVCGASSTNVSRFCQLRRLFSTVTLWKVTISNVTIILRRHPSSQRSLEGALVGLKISKIII